MTQLNHEAGEIHLTLSRSQALVLFEWLSRNSDEGYWNNPNLMADPAEKKVAYDIEADLEKVLTEPFAPDFHAKLQRARRDLVPSPDDWL